MRTLLLAAPVALAALLVGCAARPAKPSAAGTPSAVAKIRADARALAPLVQTKLARDFLAAADRLPSIAPRTVTVEGEAAPRTFDEEYYYNTKYGTPLAYARPLDLLGLDDARGLRVFDLGYGGIGHLRMLASLGAEVVGLEVDPVLRALYHDAAPGVTLVHGRLAADVTPEGRFDLIVTKNVLKNGFIHPEPGADPRTVIDLGVDDATFLATLLGLLEPGGKLLVYNITPAPNGPGKPYRTWADGRCPWSAADLERAGFRVLAHDVDDTAAVRAMAHALGWDRGEDAMNLEDDLFAHYTLLERPR